jgi:hypothetical protein
MAHVPESAQWHSHIASMHESSLPTKLLQKLMCAGFNLIPKFHGTLSTSVAGKYWPDTNPQGLREWRSCKVDMWMDAGFILVCYK